MTAEIIIMNAGAIALAADSAVTSSHGWEREKVFSSDNKIFELTDSTQVAVMNYGAASFMSIPWETVVGEYRRRHGGESYPQLRDYVDTFLRFLKEEIVKDISLERQEAFVVTTAYAIFEWIASKIQEQEDSEELVELEDEDNARMDDLKEKLASKRQEITTEILNEVHQSIHEIGKVSEATEEVIQQACSVLKQYLPELYEEFHFDADSGNAEQLENIAYASVASMIDELTESEVDFSSGIVIAGFGDDNLFPGYINLEIEGIYGGMLKWIEKKEAQIAMPPKASIAGFAQLDPYLLTAGLDTVHVGVIAALARGLLVEYTKQLVGEFSGSSGLELEKRAEEKDDQIESVVEALVEAIDEYLMKDPGGPIDDALEVVSVLPKDQLAEVAGAAISFTSLRRRVSLETETVGGPTDVAVITKGDGLVWINRKHYFPPELNPAYFARTYGRREES